VADHPVKVPAELVRQWIDSNIEEHTERLLVHNVANRAAQWGADQELEACCEWLRSKDILEPAIDALRSARRPKPPTLAEQGCDALDAYIYGNPDHGDKQNTYNTIRAALNRLAELEAQQ